MSHLEENGKQQLNAMLDQQQAQFKIRISQLEEMSKQQINSILDQQQAELGSRQEAMHLNVFASLLKRNNVFEANSRECK